MQKLGVVENGRNLQFILIQQKLSAEEVLKTFLSVQRRTRKKLSQNFVAMRIELIEAPEISLAQSKLKMSIYLTKLKRANYVLIKL